MTTIQLAKLEDFGEFAVDDVFISVEVAEVNTALGIKRVVRYAVAAIGKKNVVYKYYHDVGEAFVYNENELKDLEKKVEAVKKELKEKFAANHMTVIDGVVVQ